MNPSEQKLTPEISQAILDVNFILSIPEKTRSQEQRDRLPLAMKLVQTSFQTIYEHKIEPIFNAILTEIVDYEKKIEEALQSSVNQIPPLPAQITTESVTKVIRNTGNALTTINGQLEMAQPTYKKWVEYEKNVNNLIKAVGAFDREYTGNGVFAALQPNEVFYRIRRFGELVERLNIRSDGLQMQLWAVSRLQTLHLASPTGELNGSLPEGVSFGPKSLGRSDVKGPAFGKRG